MAGGVTIVDPRFLSFDRWARETAWNLSPFATVPDPQGEGNWLRWARYAVGIPALNALNPPRPEGFGRWQDWAVAANQSIQLLNLPG